VNEAEISKAMEQVYTLIEQLPEPRKSQIKSFMDVMGARYATAPASGSIHKHDAEPGGLLTHSLDVYKNLKLMNDALGKDLPIDSMIICGLFHDLGKIGTLGGQDMYVLVTEQWRREKGYRYEHNKDIKDGLSHAQRAVRLLSHYGVELTDDEYVAMLYHDGLYMKENELFKRVQTKLALLLHWADYYTAFFDTERV